MILIYEGSLNWEELDFSCLVYAVIFERKEGLVYRMRLVGHGINFTHVSLVGC
jgi:hypothetical protein